MREHIYQYRNISYINKESRTNDFNGKSENMRKGRENSVGDMKLLMTRPLHVSESTVVVNIVRNKVEMMMITL